MYNIICVHAGTKYSEDYVIKLFNSCKRHNSNPFTFTILHDGKNYNFNHPQMRFYSLEPMSFLHSGNLWWYKMQAFRKTVARYKINLFLDLDIVICNNMDKFWDYNNENFVVLQDFNRHWFPSYPKCNSSIFKFSSEMAESIYDSFIQNPLDHIRRFRGDQDWMDEYIKDKIFWPKHWAMSWKWEVFKGGMVECNSNKYVSTLTKIHNDCSILVFHGKPDPHEVSDTLINDNWQ